MSFVINCKCCHVELEAEDSMIGSSLTCPNCEKIVVVNRPVLKVKGKAEDTSYPGICIFAGVIMIIHAAFFFYQAFTFDPWRGGSSQMNFIKVFIGILYLLGGIGFLAKQKFGSILGIASIGLFILGGLIVVGSGELVRSGLLLPVLINAFLHVIILFGILSSNEWSKLIKNPSVHTSCPSCETKLKLKDSQINKNIKCAKCSEVFMCSA